MELNIKSPPEPLPDSAKGKLSVDTYQTVPSLLLNDLTRHDGSGRCILEHTDITVYALLKAHSQQKDNCYPSAARLAGLAGCGEKTICRSLKRLDDAGHIQRKSRKGSGKIYILTDVTKDGVIRRQRRLLPSAGTLAPTNRPQPQRAIKAAPAEIEPQAVWDNGQEPF